MEDPTQHLASTIQPRHRTPVVSETTPAVWGLTANPPKVKVIPDVTLAARKGGRSIGKAQFDFGITSPCVPSASSRQADTPPTTKV